MRPPRAARLFAPGEKRVAERCYTHEAMVHVTNPDTTQHTVPDAAARLEALLTGLQADAHREKALYHLDRLRLAVNASHQEAVRFAAFTLNKIVHDTAAEWGPEVVAAMGSLRQALHARGHEF